MGGIIALTMVIFSDIIPLRQRPKYWSLIKILESDKNRVGLLERLRDLWLGDCSLSTLLGDGSSSSISLSVP